jgi:serine protease Do
VAEPRFVFALVGSTALGLTAVALAAPKAATSATPAPSAAPHGAATPPRASAAPSASTPPSASAAPSTPAAASAPASPGSTTEDRAALASRVAVVERAGKALELGVILNGDGRVLAALSALGNAQRLDVRYADNKLVPAKVGHADRAHDLALLVPANSEHQLGLRAAREPGAALHAPLGSYTVAGQKAAPGPLLTPTGPVAFTTNDGKPFPEALGFKTAPNATSLGSPLVDTNGEVIAVVTRACQKKAGAGCAPVLVGTPVTVVREFLHSAPKGAAIPTASLGVQVAPDDSGSARGLRVTAVRGSAAALGLRAGADARTADLIVALDGVPVTTSDAFDRIVQDHAVGDVVDLLVLGGGRYRHVTVVVAPAPR